MVYIQLSESIKGYNRVRIKELNYFDEVRYRAEKTVGFKYVVYKKSGTEESVLYDKFVAISSREWIDDVFEKAYFKNLNAFDSICRILLQYLIEHGFETGTLEVS